MHMMESSTFFMEISFLNVCCQRFLVETKKKILDQTGKGGYIASSYQTSSSILKAHASTQMSSYRIGSQKVKSHLSPTRGRMLCSTRKCPSSICQHPLEAGSPPSSSSEDWHSEQKCCEITKTSSSGLSGVPEPMLPSFMTTQHGIDYAMH